MNVPRLPRGKMLFGPESIGCFNTGTRPTIAHSRQSGKYVVGIEMDVREVLRDLGTLSSKRTVRVRGRIVQVYKTRQAAVSKFTAMVAKRHLMNEADRREYQQKREAARKGDIGAALSLIDL